MTDPNPLMNNLERSLFTFNMDHLSEVCFHHVFWSKADLGSSGITSEQKRQVEACVEKYIEAFNIVKVALWEKKI